MDNFFTMAIEDFENSLRLSKSVVDIRTYPAILATISVWLLISSLFILHLYTSPLSKVQAYGENEQTRNLCVLDIRINQQADILH